MTITTDIETLIQVNQWIIINATSFFNVYLWQIFQFFKLDCKVLKKFFEIFLKMKMQTNTK